MRQSYPITGRENRAVSGSGPAGSPASVTMTGLLRGLLWVGVGVLGAVGLLSFAGPLLVLGSVAAVAGGILGHALASRRGAARGRIARRLPAPSAGRGAAAGAVSVPVVAGLVTLIGPLVVPLGFLAVCLAVTAAAWRATSEERPSGPGPDPAELQTMTTAELCRQWRGSSTLLATARGAGELGRVAQRRAALLEEIERRDPDGFRRWMDGDALAGDPAFYLA